MAIDESAEWWKGTESADIEEYLFALTRRGRVTPPLRFERYLAVVGPADSGWSEPHLLRGELAQNAEKPAIFRVSGMDSAGKKRSRKVGPSRTGALAARVKW